MPRVPSSEGRRFRLRGELGGKAVEFVLVEGANTVGSAAEAEVPLPVREVSRRHAVLQVGDHGVSVEDLDSKNGTFVNGVRVRRAALRHGDWLQLGPVILTVEAVAADELELGIPLASARPGSQSVGRVKDTTTDLGVARHAPVPWSEALAAFGRCVLRPAEPDITGALAALALALDTEPIALLSCRDGGGVLVRQIFGDVAGLGAALTPQTLRVALASTRSGDDLSSGFLDGDWPLVLAGRGAAGNWPVVLVVGGHAATPDLRPVLETALRMLDHAHPGDGEDNDDAGPQRSSELAFPVGHVVCPSPPMQAVYRQLELLLSGRMPVLVTGETGVGKEHVVRILRASSDRGDGPLEVVNCAAIPSELLEAELFGIEEGIATGVKAREGCFRRANGGIVFLDEIGDMPPALQAKLLRTLQDGEVHPVGARRPARIDVRVVTATNTELEERMHSGSFRRDLYYRIAGCRVHVPPLRERTADVPPLVAHFLERSVAETGRRVRGISVAALATLSRAGWPGNVRELENEVRRLVQLCPDGRAIESDMVSPSISAPAAAPQVTTAAPDDLHLLRRVAELEGTLVRQALARSAGNLSEAARLLGVSRNGLVMKMQRLGITR
jgi:DNA-binding NtrC family response regulator/pSer/pThr/pTyr-binding forkhead associated (FHA) protein